MKTIEFEELMKMSGIRPRFPSEEIKDFVKFAKEEYTAFGQVNWEEVEDEEDMYELVESYISNSCEAILLYKKFKKESIIKKELELKTVLLEELKND